MIGVLCQPEDEPVAREFFELFKTPWELYQDTASYPVVLSVGMDVIPEIDCRLLVIYHSRLTDWDASAELETELSSGVRCVRFLNCQFPTYQGLVAFTNKERESLVEMPDPESVEHDCGRISRHIVRVGYQLFEEVRFLLTTGQPAEFADYPTLDRHIGLLRDLILRHGLPLAEIPPTPAGYPFAVCLSHDIDQPLLGLHRWDHTMWGFLARASAGSLIDFLRGRTPLKSVFRNVWAIFKLPSIWAGWTKDIWLTFDRYCQIERGLAATYYVIPFKGRPGKDPAGRIREKRASAYDPDDIDKALQAVTKEGHEVGVHGIDSWRDAAAGRNELNRMQGYMKGAEKGIRMHWLYWDEHAAGKLEEAGFTYDATLGYCETIGFQTGTAQVHRPLGANQLLELPLQVMDTALFFPSYLNLSEREALDRMQSLTDHTIDSGGTITINWHDRSLAPERLWGNVYLEMINRWKEMGAWFATHGQAVAWFRKRRSVSFQVTFESRNRWRVGVNAPEMGDLPQLQLRVHRPHPIVENIPLSENAELILTLPE